MVNLLIRNSERRILYTRVKRVRDPSSILGAKLQVSLYEILFCIDNGLHNMQVFSDSLMVVQSVTRSFENLGHVKTTIFDLNDLLCSNCALGIHQMYCLANMTAHYIAKFALTSSFPSVWVESGFPS